MMRCSAYDGETKEEIQLGENGMGRVAGVFLFLLALLVSVSALAFAETVTAENHGLTNVSYSNGYYGYCIDEGIPGAYIDDVFDIAEDTSAARNNDDDSDISQKLKVFFVHCFEDIFDRNEKGEYTISASLKDSDIPHVIYKLTDNSYTWGNQNILLDKVNDYTGPEIPDHGYEKTLDNGDVVQFDFLVFQPRKENQQSFFAYKIKTIPAGTSRHQVTVTDDGNGRVTASRTSGINGTEVRLSIVPADGYVLDRLIVGGEDKTSEVSNGKYTFSIQNADVNVQAVFRKTQMHACGNGMLVEGEKAGCENDGWKAYYECSCGKLYEDKACTKRIADLNGWKSGAGKIEADHHYGDYQYNQEKHWKECVCKDKTEEGFHFFDDDFDTQCDTCGYVRSVSQKDFKVTVTTDANGAAETSLNSASVGEDVVLTIRPKKGFRLSRLFANDQDVTKRVSGNVYTFRMPDYAIEFRVLFEAIPTIGIEQQPEHQQQFVGGYAVFSVTAVGEGLTYQWYIDRNDGKGWCMLKGADERTYTTSAINAQNEGFRYRCRISDRNGNVIETETAVLHVTAMPSMPETGDFSSLLFWMLMGLLSMIGMALLQSRNKPVEN